MNVLLVEDDELVRMCLLDVLSDAGIEAVAASSGDEAVGCVERLHDLRVLISDVCLGYGMSGIALAEVARRRWPRVRIMLMSGSKQWAETVTESTGYVDAIFQKPFESDTLVSAVLRAA